MLVHGSRYPICQSTIPYSEMSPTGRHMWGNGASTSFNIRVCVEADDYLFFQVRLLPGYQSSICQPPTYLPICLPASMLTRLDQFLKCAS
jgi:hypothetical protein